MLQKSPRFTHIKKEEHNSNHEELNSALDLLQKYKRDASIQREINMIREAAHNIIVHIKYILNEKNKLFERHKRNIIESQQTMGQEVKNMVAKLTWTKSDIPLKTLIKADEKVEF